MIRERLREKYNAGTLTVVAAAAKVPEWVLRDWCDNPMNTPTRAEIVSVQSVLGEQVSYGGST